MSFQSQRRLVLNASWASVVPDRAVFQPLPVVAQPSVETVIGLKTRAVIRYLLLRRVLGGPVLMLATSTNSIGGPAILLQLAAFAQDACLPSVAVKDRKSTRLNSSHVRISYAVFCLKKKNPHELHP